MRYRGLAKNAAQMYTLFALFNLWMARKRLSLAAPAGRGNPPQGAKNCEKRTNLTRVATEMPRIKASKRFVQAFLKNGRCAVRLDTAATHR